MTDITAATESLLLDEGASLVGFADIRELPSDIRQGMDYAVSIALALDPVIIRGIADGPTAPYYEEYCRANRFLSRLVKRTADFLREKGCRAHAIEPTVEALDDDTLATPLPHKTVATRAGLGSIGKSALLVTERFGTAVRLTTVLCDYPFETGTPVNTSRCGNCHECVTHCPARAISGNHWEAGIERALICDAFACCKTARDLSAKIGIKATICGICIHVCPWTQKYIKTSNSR
ncbi:4Fe-4S binding protein [bacterium]|nr:4Fe-4S binding protein [bacterium]